MTKKQVADKYLNEYSKFSQRSVAKVLYEENKEMFSDIEDARTVLRAVLGKRGKSRTGYVNKELAKEREGFNWKEIPESHTEEWTPYVIPNSIGKLLILSDIHIPYHDIDAIKLALEYGKNNGCDAVLLNGDLMDCYELSRFEKNPKKRSFADELEDTRQFLRFIKKHFTHVYYKLGNHDERWEKWLWRHPEVIGIPEFRLDVILRLAEIGVEYITDQRIVNVGHLSVLHGHEFFGAPSQAVNPARGLFMKTLESCIIGHLHKTSENTEKSLGGKLITTWSAGCLSDITPPYARINRWNLGFAMVDVNIDGTYNLHNKRIFNNKIL